MAASTGTGNYPDVVQANNANTFATISSGHTVTLTDHITGCNFFRIDAGATLVGGGFSITIDNDSSNHSFINNGTISGVLDVIITNPNGQSNFNANGEGGNVRNLTVNNSGAVVTLSNEDQTLDGDLTITAGELTTNDGSADRNLTVGGGIKNTGTLTANSSTILITGEIAGFALDQMGTFNAGTSTIQIGDGSTSTVGSSTHFKTNNCHNLIINQHIDAPNGNVAWRVYTGTELTIGGNLTVTRGRFYRNTSTQDLTVTGDVNIASVGKLGTSSASGSNTFGSLTVNSGGTYQATSGTTTINGDPGGYPNLGINLDGTFTHNNGTLKYTGGSGGLDLKSTGNLYNFEHAPTGTTFITNNTTIENNLTMTGANFQGVNGNENLTVKGNVTINSSGQTMNFNGASEHTFGFLTILDGTYKVQNDTGGFTKVGGIRNVGGTVSNAV